MRCGVSKADLFASLVVFLVALPLCVGVAIASEVPAELGLVTGIVGGLVVGALPGSSLRVSGPAAGLTVLVYEAVRTYGIGALGVLVFAAGVVQLGLVPVAALAGLLMYAGCRLVPVRQVRGLWAGHRGEVVVLGVTAVAIVVGNLFEGVLVGLALAVAKTAWDISHVHVETEDLGEAGIVVRVLGHATFLRLPKLLDALEGLPYDRAVRLELDGLRHVDHACAAALEGWAAARGHEDGDGDEVEVVAVGGT